MAEIISPFPPKICDQRYYVTDEIILNSPLIWRALEGLGGLQKVLESP